MLSLLGLARRAGFVVSGIPAVREGARRDEIRLVLFAEDAAEGQVAKVQRILEPRRIPFRRLGDRRGLGTAIGESPRSAVAITDTAFAQELLQRLPTPVPGRGESEGTGGSSEVCG